MIQMQDLVLGFIVLYKVHLLKLVQVSLNYIPSLDRVDCTIQPGVIHKLAECTFDPTVYTVDQDIKY